MSGVSGDMAQFPIKAAMSGVSGDLAGFTSKGSHVWDQWQYGRVQK